MAASERIDDLRRRVQEDPASIAFAQLAEEYRRAGRLAEAIDTCRAGLSTHPEYVSARVTLGRALLALGRLDDASAELRLVLAAAPENLAATRALAEASRRQGRPGDALTYYTAALALAPSDPDLERIVSDLARALAAAEPPESDLAIARGLATIAALEQWLEAIHAARADRRP
jgi:tetratricopeptide (TPR) repeat protein